MVWLAFAVGLTLGVFSGGLVLGLIRELGACKESACLPDQLAEQTPEIQGTVPGVLAVNDPVPLAQ